MKILMVCLGNICRSPLAEGILKKKVAEAGLNWEVASAGTNGFHVGEAPHRHSCMVASENGIDISSNIARRFSKDDFEKYDLIYAMAGDVIEEMKQISGKSYNAQKVKLLMDETYPGKNMDVPDPWYGDASGYYPVYEMIEKACNAIMSHYSKEQHV